MNNKEPIISVIMSTYNRKPFLVRSVESVLSQTYTDFEFILVNNGCTDGSHIICNDYFEKDKRIKLINIDVNLGAANGKNKGIDLASGEYITFVDDDDYCESMLLEFLLNLIQQYDADISICGSWYDFNGEKKPKFLSEQLLVLDKVKGIDELLKRENYNVSPPTKLYKRTLFEGIRFKDNVLVDDIHIIYKIFVKANAVVFKGTPLYTFVRHEGNMTSYNNTNNLSPDLLNEYIQMYSERTKYLSEKVPAIKERAVYSQWSYMISMCDKIIKYGCIRCEKQYNYMKKTLKENYKEILKSPFTTEKEKELMKIYINC